MSRLASLFVYAISTSVALAATLDASLIQTSGLPSVGSGKFYGYRTYNVGPGDNAFSNAYNKAVSEGVPLVVIWSNEGCEHCDTFINELNANKSSVSAWLSSQKAVCTFFKDNLDDDEYADWYWKVHGYPDTVLKKHSPKACLDAWMHASGVCGAEYSWPLFAFYYKRGDGIEVTWGSPEDDSGTDRHWENFKAYYEQWIEKNGIGQMTGGAQFAVSDTEFDRYEAEPSTEFIDVELVRDAERAFSGGRDLLVAAYPGETGLLLTNAVEWAKSETNKNCRLPVAPPGSGGYCEGGTIALMLLDKDGEVRETAHIFCRATMENSNNNPLWIGEKTADNLSWGEWTVDLAAATGKVAAAKGEAYTIVSVQGSLWCPDCANTDANFLSLLDGNGDNRFRKWAESNHVALVVVDIPNYSARNGATPEGCKSPSMFSKVAYASLGATRSGRPYLSRKMVSDDEAMAMRARNHFLVTSNTASGGFHRPEDTNSYRTGVPIFVLLRKDGSVASRLTRFAAASPGSSDRSNWDRYIARFDEMLALAADAAEIEDSHHSTTEVSLTPWSSVNASLRHVDTQDFALIPDASVGSHIKLSLSSESTNAVTLSVVSESGSALKSAYGPIGGLAVEADIAADGRWFAKVSCGNTDKGFAVDEAVSTMTPYELSMECYIQPQEKAETSVPSGDSVIFRIVSGELYCFTGLVLPAGSFEPVEGGTGLYRAMVSGDVAVNVEEGAKSITYQLWHPGTAEFTRSTQDVYTHMGSAAIKVRRVGGVSGAKTEYVRLASADELAAGRYVWTGDAPVSWEDGESGEKTVVLGVVKPGSVMHAPGKLVFEVCDSRLAVTLLDKDAPGLELLDYDSVATYRYFSSGLSFDTVNLLSGNHVSVRVLSGSLPQGMRLQYDEADGKVKLLGEPIAAGEYEFSVALAEIRDNGYVTGPSSKIRVKVETTDDVNPYLTKARPSEALPLYMTKGGKDVVAGTLTVAIASRGRISARYVGTEAKTVAFSGSWQELDGESGVARAVFAKNGCTLEMEMDKNGAITAYVTLPPAFSYFAEDEADIVMRANSAWPGEDSFDEYRGVYNVVFPSSAGSRPDAPSGTGILTLRMATDSAVQSGRFTYSGFMPDGTPLNGSASAVRHSAFGVTSIHVPVFKRVGRNCLSAVFAIKPYAAENWNSPNNPKAREVVGLANGSMAVSIHRDTAWEYDVVHEMAVGSYYVPRISPLELSDMFYTNLYARPIIHLLRFAADGVESPMFGTLSVSDARIVPSENSMELETKITGLSFRLTPRNGMFTGSVVLTFFDENGNKKKKVTGSYRGLLTPGWVRNCDCGDIVPEWYFGSGFLRYRDFNSDGRAVIKSIPVTLSPPDVF